MQTAQRLLNKASVKGIMNKRTTADAKLVGKKIMLTIQGNGNTIDVKNASGETVASVVEPGTVFQKVIFNTKSNSGIAMRSVRNTDFLKAGLAAEVKGDFDEAHKQYSAFLNGVQLTFSVPTTSPVAEQLSDGLDISAKLIQIDTPNGSLLTIDPATIRILEPEVLGSVAFSFDDEPAETTSTVAEALQA